MNLNAETAAVLDGKATAKQIRQEVAAGSAELHASHGVVPGLTVVLVGDDPASSIYVRNKEKAAKKCGMNSSIVSLPANTTEDAIISTVERLNADPAVHGILVQLPLPDGVDEQRVIETIHPDKDVDGFHPQNAGRLMIGIPGFVPCTPAGVIEMLKRNEIELKGKHAVVIGRSNIVGKPMALLLLREHCTVTVCHSRTKDLPGVAAQADILIAAVGRLGMVDASFIRPGAVVVDVGIHRVEDEETVRRLFGEDEKRLEAVRTKGSTVAGDVHPVDARGRAGWLTPVPGGVGPLTIAMLLKNALDAARRSVGLD
ncbi:MAG: bifunctional methylenetetrahydrofolate dehydrogenase/methenyltetrahydrofolate cyclohydrolase FolD [bacterium]|nr:bifunctional methylenetetrahydrofolate dehydrogenase/methenyltetrahydrofolate cyclohydrolase FolD [bacterium]